MPDKAIAEWEAMNGIKGLYGYGREPGSRTVKTLIEMIDEQNEFDDNHAHLRKFGNCLGGCSLRKIIARHPCPVTAAVRERMRPGKDQSYCRQTQLPCPRVYLAPIIERYKHINSGERSDHRNRK